MYLRKTQINRVLRKWSTNTRTRYMYCSSERHGVNINNEKFFLKRNKQRQSLMCSRNCKVNNFKQYWSYVYFTSSITATNFSGRTSIKYFFMQTQLLRFCKDTAKDCSLPLLEITTKSNHFLPAKKIPILWIELQTNINKKGLKTLHLNIEW